MTIVEGLVAEVREACAVKAEQYGCPSNGAAIRGSAGALSATIVRAGLDAIRKYFKDYEERVMYRSHKMELKQGDYLDSEAHDNWQHDTPVLFFVPKPAREMLTVSRETLAVLTEYVKDVPNKDMVLDAAMTEAKEAL